MQANAKNLDKRGPSPLVSTMPVHRQLDDEILERLSPAFLVLLEFVREQKVNQVAGATISQTEKEVKNIE